ncbi:hypothetical protein LTR81_011193 [Elasticomyces elasticus]
MEYKDEESEKNLRSMGLGSAGGMPMPKMISPEEVRQEARKRSSSIFEDWLVLKAVLLRHEGTIHERWLKKTKAQRLKILLAAWPNMPASHRPDYIAFRKETPAQREAGTQYRDEYLWP